MNRASKQKWLHFNPSLHSIFVRYGRRYERCIHSSLRDTGYIKRFLSSDSSNDKPIINISL